MCEDEIKRPSTVLHVHVARGAYLRRLYEPRLSVASVHSERSQEEAGRREGFTIVGPSRLYCESSETS